MRDDWLLDHTNCSLIFSQFLFAINFIMLEHIHFQLSPGCTTANQAVWRSEGE